MKQTYEEAMTQVYADEGGYSNDAGDAGGPTKYGITIWDARKYWKSTATASDVRAMPKSVAADIYSKHYAQPIHYDDLPSGVDYAVLDYGINSGLGRSNKVLQRIVGVPADGQIGQTTVDACFKKPAADIINAIYDERVAFLRRLGQSKPQFLNGWLSRCRRGRQLALSLAEKYPNKRAVVQPEHAGTGAVVVGGGVAASQYPHLAIYIIVGTLVLAIGSYFLIKYFKGKKTNGNPPTSPNPQPGK